MTRRERAVVPASSPIRTPLQPHVEPINRAADQPEQPNPEVRNSRSTEVSESVTPEVPDSQSPAPDGPRWAALERKETRLRADQVQDLAALRRRVSAQRTTRSEIITDNTLIRIAVDLLLEQGDRLAGDTEAELLRSARPRRRS
ncbi:hypothetical protein [Streptomyces sp. NBC_00304]|uniref:hypothetical protein n=1 Tax=Streptomyces sp. NBC_00304 TaxID=2975706 RepID=UPI002E27E005|nr:hypothetical protein [Streptomyces sp. NBC_00304]